MSTDVFAFTSVALNFAVLGFIYKKLSRHPLDPIALFCYMFFWFYLFRAGLISLSLDTPYPDYLFVGSNVSRLVLKQSLVITFFLGLFAATFVMFQPAFSSLTRLVPVTADPPPLRRQVHVVVLLTAAGTLITVMLLARFGGPQEMIRAAKVDKELAGFFVLKIFPAIGSLVAIGLVLDLLQRPSREFASKTLLLPLALVCAVVGSAYVFLWGSRTTAAVSLLVLLMGRAVFRRGQKGRRRRTRLVRFVVVAAIVLGLAVWLRVSRDVYISGQVNRSIADARPLRQLSVSTNSTSFDASLLALRDWPRNQPYRRGEDFYNGVVGMIPRPLWPGKPEAVVTGVWFRQVYEPDIRNGWPPGPIGEWYINFGYWGIAVGGILSGLLFAVLTRAARRAAVHPFNFASITAVVILTAKLGFTAETPLRWMATGVPLLVVASYLGGRRQRAPATKPLLAAAESRASG